MPRKVKRKGYAGQLHDAIEAMGGSYCAECNNFALPGHICEFVSGHLVRMCPFCPGPEPRMGSDGRYKLVIHGEWVRVSDGIAQPGHVEIAGDVFTTDDEEAMSE